MTELPVIMASLEIDDTQASSVETAKERNNRSETVCAIACRMLRKRVQGTYQPCESSKRRCSLRPTKLTKSQEIDDARSYFMSKKFRSMKVKTLATIFEEPKVKKNGAIVHTGQTKMRRINFNIISKDKIRKRKAKVKKIMSHKSPKKGRMSMEEFLPRLQRLMNSPSIADSDKSVVTSLANCEMG
jgi:hypothetical protein